jgi:HlyD family secretion protein
MSVRKNRQSLADAQEALAEAKAGPDALALAQAKMAVSEAQVSIEAAQEARAELDEGPDATALATAQADLVKKRLAVADAEAALAATSLVAPFDGTILEVYVNGGDTVAANTPILALADLTSLQVVASVDETTIRQVSAGQGAAISFDAYTGLTFEGQVLSVPLQGTLQGGVTVYDVPLSLSGAEELNLLVGMTANVAIEVGEASDALLVPTLALQKVTGGYQVSVPNTVDPAGEPETVPVQIGLSDGTYTQIVKGLNEGDQVIVELESTDSNSFFRTESGGIFSGIFRTMGRR